MGILLIINFFNIKHYGALMPDTKVIIILTLLSNEIYNRTKQFISGWKLNSLQLQNVLSRGSL